MKKNINSALYFSAYPLKAIKGSSPEQSSFLKFYLSGHTRKLSRIRVSPMLNPYKESRKTVKNMAVEKNIEPTGTDWFNHYE
jgi:hypothetical protein